jgi:hypothetical protein
LVTDVEHIPTQPRIAVLPAIRRHWLLAVAPVVLFVGGALALALKRPPQYSATATVAVGHVYVGNPFGIPSIIEATEALAGVYSRAIDANAVITDVERRLGVNASRVSGNLSATQIPSSPLIKVTADSSSAQGAVALANAASDALVAYVNGQVRDNNASATLSDQYRHAALRFRHRKDVRDRAARRYAQHPTTANRDARDAAASLTDTAQLRLDALRASYQTAVQGGTSSIGVDAFTRASSPSSDRWRIAQILVFVALIGGLALGTALALLREARHLRLHPLR